MERARAFRHLVADGDEGTLGWELDPLVGHGRVGQRGGYHKAPQRRRPESWRLAGTDGHSPEHRSPVRRRLSVSPHPTFEEDGAYTKSRGDLRDSLQLLPQRGCTRRGEREPVGQRPLCACPVADDLPERRRGVVQPYVPLHGDGILGEQGGRRSLNQEVPTVARGTYDNGYRGNGNWPFNTAYAASYGLKASVNRFSSLGQVELWIAKGVPVIASISWGRGELTGTPIPASSGHLL